MTNALTATLRTNRGTVVVRLLPDHAPKTVRNFVELAEGGREWTDPNTGETAAAKLYDGTIFHRVIPDFMIQGGDPLGTGTGGPGYKFADEIHPDLALRPSLPARHGQRRPGHERLAVLHHHGADAMAHRQAHDLRRGRLGRRDRRRGVRGAGVRRVGDRDGADQRPAAGSDAGRGGRRDRASSSGSADGSRSWPSRRRPRSGCWPPGWAGRFPASARSGRPAPPTGKPTELHALAGNAYRTGMRLAKVEALIAPIIGIALQGAFILVLGVGGYLVAGGTMQVAQLVRSSCTCS